MMYVRLSVGLILLAFIIPGYAEEMAPKVALEQLELPPVSQAPWQFTEFPIIAWWGPPGTAKLEDFENYRDAGFTLYAVNPDEGFEQALKYADEAGIPVMVFRTPQGFGLDAKEVAFPTNDPNVMGWITHDEPGYVPDAIEAIRAVNSLMREDPTRWAFFNFLPPQAQPHGLTDSIIDAAVRHGMPILSYDIYVVIGDGTTATQAHFSALELFRNASLRHGVLFWAFALTTQHWHYRQPSESDLRWKQYTNLAYGAKGLWYFCYWGPHDWENWDDKSIVNPRDGSLTERYTHIQALNHAVLDMGPILLRLRSKDVVHTNPIDGVHQFESDTYWITDVESDTDWLIGFFEDHDETKYALLVNLAHGMDLSAAETERSITLLFAEELTGVTAVNWLDGTPGPLSLDGNQTTLAVAGGTGVLLRAD